MIAVGVGGTALLNAAGDAPARFSASVDPAPPPAPVDVEGCPRWVDPTTPDRRLPNHAAPADPFVPGTPRSAVVCRYPRDDRQARHRTDLAGTRALPDPAEYARALRAQPALPTGGLACPGAGRQADYVVMFGYDDGLRHGVRVMSSCPIAADARRAVLPDAELVARLDALFPEAASGPGEPPAPGRLVGR
ncbi:hypothetical protein B4N89_31505 [Embleya scabrispora]|uniref:Uncharacterized protein n=1 Tax=Embleya scabrispora TaxID=159449 RepID=A0A1T3NPL0_9ACTN|nr:hypothetical protein [Embleya scabrispora]OPC78694.1 hypothetical protein B4N89_31505 [Embleya scabrispora]